MTKMIDKHSLRNYAVLVRFTGKCWGISRKIKDVSEDVAKQYDAETSTVSVVKLLINPKTPEYAAIKSHLGLAGNLFRGMAGPWDKVAGGWWIITTKGHAQLHALMLEMETRFDELVTEFHTALPGILAQAQSEGGQLYRAELIPSLDEIRDKFEFTFETEILPDRSGTILDMDEKRAQAIATAAEATTFARYKDLTAHLHEKVRDELTDAVANLREYGDVIEGSKRGRSFKDSQVERLQRLCDLLPALNIEGNPRLDKLAKDIAANLTLTPAAELRGNKVKGDTRTKERREADAASLREKTADAAETLLNDLGSIFGDAG